MYYIENYLLNEIFIIDIKLKTDHGSLLLFKFCTVFITFFCFHNIQNIIVTHYDLNRWKKITTFKTCKILNQNYT